MKFATDFSSQKNLTSVVLDSFISSKNDSCHSLSTLIALCVKLVWKWLSGILTYTENQSYTFPSESEKGNLSFLWLN